MALVRELRQRSIVLTSTFSVSDRQSASTGRAPRYVTTSPVAVKVYVGMTTSSPALTPTASRARCSAAVAELTARAWRARRAFAKSCWNCRTLGPVVNHPDRSVSATSATSSSLMDGRWNGTVWSDRDRSRSDNDPASMDESVDKVESHRRLLTVRESLGLAYISGGIAVGRARHEDVNSVVPDARFLSGDLRVGRSSRIADPPVYASGEAMSV